MAVTLSELQEQLANVRVAKKACLAHSQSSSIGSRSLTRVNFKDLCDEEKRILRMISKIENGGGINVAYGVPE